MSELLSKEYIEQLYGTATIQRWTDHVRPIGLTALGKHSHLMTIAWTIGRYAEMEDSEKWRGQIDWDYLIRIGLYELLKVSVLTDIKSPVLNQIRSDKQKWDEINEAAVEDIKEAVPNLPEWIAEEMLSYYKEEFSSPGEWNAYWIARAASSLASEWEFRLIETANPKIYDLAETQKNIEKGVLRHQYIPGVLDIFKNRNDLSQFVDLCGRLRFQLRWSQTPIIPERPVLDHALLVAHLSYAALLGTSGKVKINSVEMWERYQVFFGALFHDLSEVLTRDVVSPVKAMADGAVGAVLGNIEKEWFAEVLKPILPKRMYKELEFFSINEFADKSWLPDDWPVYLADFDKCRQGTSHRGKLIEACDKFAAFMEAYYSWSYGVQSDDFKSLLRPSPETQENRSELNMEDDFSYFYEFFSEKSYVVGS